MPSLLISNDDGVDSPTLVPLTRELARLGQTRVVVPHVERSWIGKAITRFESLLVDTTERGPYAIQTVTGTPADCVNLALYTLPGDRPDLVVSGINLGWNTGVAFLLSSGTVGAAMEAWIAGIPAVAFSMGIPGDAYGLRGEARTAALGARAERAAEVAADITAELLRSGLPSGVDLLTVNMPADATRDTPRVVTRLTRTRYGRLFAQNENGIGYHHQFSGLENLEQDDDGDMISVARGVVSITPIRLDLTAPIDADMRRRFESH